MVVLDDIWITLEKRDVDPEGETEGLKEALDAFHQTRRARGAFEIIDPKDSPLPPDQAEAGVVAVAATLGEEVERLIGMPWLEECLKAGLFQLEAYLNYRIQKFIAPKKLFIGHPAVPGGAAAPELKLDQVLALLPGNGLGLSVQHSADGDTLRPTWSIAYLYPLGRQPAEAANPCAGCSKDCALRRR